MEISRQTQTCQTNKERTSPPHPFLFVVGMESWTSESTMRQGEVIVMLLTAYEFNPGGIREMTASLFRFRLCGLLQQLYP
jgi:hypothetical protein